MRGLQFVLVIVLLAAFSSPAQAATYSWTAVSPSDWSLPANWSGGTSVPTNSDTAYIVNGGTATVTQLGETCGTLSLGSSAGSGTVQMTGGALSVSLYLSGESVGYTGTGTFTQSGGTNSLSISNYCGLNLACNTGSSGTYVLSGGLLSAWGVSVGVSSTGTFIQSGGTNSMDNAGLCLGQNGGANGTYTLSSGELLSTGSELVGYAGNGTFTQSSGTNSITNAHYNTLYVALNQVNGTYNLNGGLLVVPALATGTGTPTFNFSGGTLQANGSFSTSLPMTLGTSGGGATFDTAGYALTLAGSLSGPGSLTKVDSGALLLVAGNTYTGVTTVSSGTLQIGNGGYGEALASPSIADNATLAFDHLDAMTYAGSITGSGALAKLGSGLLTLTGSNTYTGGTTIVAGGLEVTSTAALPGYTTPGKVAVDNGAVLAVSTGNNGFNVAGINGLLSGIGSGFAAGSAVGIDTTGGSLAYPAANLNANIGLAKLGTNVLSLSGSGVYTGPTTISGGTLSLAHPLAAQNSTVNVNTGGALSFAAGNTSPTLGGLAGAGNVALATAAAEPVTLNVGGNGQSTTYSGIISGAGGLTKQGTGVLTLSAPSTYSGPTVIAAGVVNFVGLPGVTGATISAGGTASPGSYSLTGGALTITAAGTDFWGGTQQGYYVYAPVPATQNFDVAVHIASMTTQNTDGWEKAGIMARQDASSNAVPTVFDAETEGNGVSFQSVNQMENSQAGTSLGPNWLRMTYNATTDVFTGYESPSTSSTAPAASDSSWVAITSYTVSMGSANTFLLGIAATAHDNADTLTAVFDNLGTMSSLFAPAVPRNFLPAATALSIAGGGTLDLSGGSQRVASLSDKTPGNGGSVINSSSAASVLTLSPSGGSTTFSGMIQGGGTLGTISLVTSGSGTQVLAGSNTYTGGTTVAAGTLQLGDAANNGYVQGNILDNATVAFANPAPQAYPGVISGSGCLTKTGSGTLSLTGSNTYTGPTAINAGGLVVAGSLGSTAITVGGGATLGGTGSIGGTVVVLGGSTAGTQGAINLADGTIGTLTLSDPNAADTVLTLGGLTVGNPSAFTFEVGAIADRILVTAGKVAVNPGGSLINITALSGFGPGTYDLMDFPSGQASGLGYLSLATTSVNGYPVYLQSTPTAEQLVAVPEPGALALVAAGLACGAATGLRRRRKSVTPAMLHIVSGDGYGTEGKS